MLRLPRRPAVFSVFALSLIGFFPPILSAQTTESVNWSPDPSLSKVENLLNLLEELENEFASGVWYLELHFQSLQDLIEAYPPSETLADDLIANFTDSEEGLKLSDYLTGQRQLVMAYQSEASGALSYIRYSLPSGYLRNPDNHYPVYSWVRGGGPNYYPADIQEAVYGGQLSGMPIEGTPSGVMRSGFTVMPGALGGRDYTGNEAEDFFQGFDAVLTRFDDSIDRNRLYMGGFSNGGKGTFLLTSVSLDTYHWAAIGLCAPAVTTQAMIDGYIDALSGTPVWLAVGAEDGLVTAARNLRDAFETIGNTPEVYYEVEGLAHEWTWAFQTDMFGFFNEHTYEPEDIFAGDFAVTLSVEPSPASPGALQLTIDTPIAVEVELQESNDLLSWTRLERVTLEAGESRPVERTAAEIGESSETPRYFRLVE